jgi:hypothetical protein
MNEGKSPVFTHVAASLQGLTTIRALGAQEKLISQFDEKQVFLKPQLNHMFKTFLYKEVKYLSSGRSLCHLVHIHFNFEMLRRLV